MGRKRGRKKKPNNDRNMTNTSQPRPGFIPAVVDKGKDTRKGEGGETDKRISKKEKGRSIIIRQ